MFVTGEGPWGHRQSVPQVHCRRGLASLCALTQSSPRKLCQVFTPGAHDLETLAKNKTQNKKPKIVFFSCRWEGGDWRRGTCTKVGARDGQRGLGQLPRKERVEAAIEQQSNSS